MAIPAAAGGGVPGRAFGLPIVVTARDLASPVIHRAAAWIGMASEQIRRANFRILGSAQIAHRQMLLLPGPVQQTAKQSLFLAGSAAVARKALTGLSVAAALSVPTFARFDERIALTGALSGATAADMERLRIAALEGAKGLGLAPVAAADLTFNLRKAGFEIDKVAKAIPAAAILIRASMDELGPEKAGLLLKQAASIFRKTGDDFLGTASAMIKSFAGTALQARKLPLAFGIVAPAVKQVSGTFEEALALSALVSNVFVVNVRRGATGVRSLVDALADTQEAANIESAFGIKVMNEQGTVFRSTTQVIGELVQKMLSMNAGQRAATISSVGFRREVLNGLFAISALIDATREQGKELDVSRFITTTFAKDLRREFVTKDTAKRVLGVMQTTAGRAREMSAAFGRAQVALGGLIAPAATVALDIVAKSFDRIATLVQALPGPFRDVLGLILAIKVATLVPAAFGAFRTFVLGGATGFAARRGIATGALGAVTGAAVARRGGIGRLARVAVRRPLTALGMIGRRIAPVAAALELGAPLFAGEPGPLARVVGGIGEALGLRGVGLAGQRRALERIGLRTAQATTPVPGQPTGGGPTAMHATAGTEAQAHDLSQALVRQLQTQLPAAMAGAVPPINVTLNIDGEQAAQAIVDAQRRQAFAEGEVR